MMILELEDDDNVNPCLNKINVLGFTLSWFYLTHLFIISRDKRLFII